MNIKNCCECNKEDKQKNLKRINGCFICKACHIKKKQEHREFLKRDVLGIRKREDLIKEWKERRELQAKAYKELNIIKNSKFNLNNSKRERTYGRRNIKKSCLGLYITRDEKKMLYLILIKKGHTMEEANKHINQVSKKMGELSKELNKLNLKEEDLNTRFKEEFAKLVERS